MIIISDTTPFNYLLQLGATEVLPSLYESVVIPEDVRQGMLHQKAPAVVRTWAAQLPDWVVVRQPRLLLPLPLDKGERAAISLALEDKADLVLMDERQGRQVAQAQGLKTIGTLGILVEAANEGLVDLTDVLTRLQQTDFYVSAELIRKLLASQTTEQE